MASELEEGGRGPVQTVGLWGAGLGLQSGVNEGGSGEVRGLGPCPSPRGTPSTLPLGKGITPTP